MNVKGILLLFNEYDKFLKILMKTFEKFVN